MALEFHLHDEFNYSPNGKQAFKEELAVFNAARPESERLYYIAYWHSLKERWVWFICEKDFCYKWRNLVRNENRRRDTESRCVFPSLHFNEWKKCRAKCSECPYGKAARDKQFTSLENLQEKGEQAADPSYSMEDELIDGIDKRRMSKKLGKELALLEETDREILLLFSKGYSDPKIAEKLGKNRFWVLRRRNALFARLKEKLEKS